MCETIKKLPMRLEELRLAKGYTKRQIAAILGVSEAMYCRVISGQRSLPDNHIETIAKALDADPDELKALSLADKVLSETSSYTNKIVGKALKIVNENHQ